MSPNTFILPETIYHEIVTHAREGKPQEVCGVLRGRGTEALQLVRAENVAPDPVQDFVVDARTLLLQFKFEDIGDEMVGIYHSHPVSPAYPSASDAWNSHYPDCIYLICSLENDLSPDLRAFRLLEHAVQLDLENLANTLGFEETRRGRFGYYQAKGAPVPPDLETLCNRVPAPFYIVFEAPDNEGKNDTARVVSITECHIEIVSESK